MPSSQWGLFGIGSDVWKQLGFTNLYTCRFVAISVYWITLFSPTPWTWSYNWQQAGLRKTATKHDSWRVLVMCHHYCYHTAKETIWTIVPELAVWECHSDGLPPEPCTWCVQINSVSNIEGVQLTCILMPCQLPDPAVSHLYGILYPGFKGLVHITKT